MATKIRLVLCPKCNKVLPELPEFNVYRCGGCGITLQAKQRVNIVRSTESDIITTENVQENQTDHVREEKEEQRSRNKDVVPCSEECSSCQNDESDQSKSGDCDAENPKGVGLTNGDEKNENRRSESSGSGNGGSEVSSEVFSPTTEFLDDKVEKFVPNVGDEEEDESSDRENEGSDDHGNNDFSPSESEEFDHNENENEESSREFVPSSEFARNENEESSREFVRNDNEDFSPEFEKTENEEFGEDETAELARIASESFSVPRGEDLEPQGNEESSSSLAKANGESDSKVKSSNAVRFAAVTQSVQSASDHILTSPRSALKQPQNGAHKPYGRLRSIEFDPSSELSGSIAETSKSPARSSFAYDGSISSYDGIYEQFPHDQLRSFEGRTRRDKFMAQPMMNKWDRDEFLEPPRHERPARIRRPERLDLPSSSLEFQRYSSFQSSDLSEDPEQMMKLLRTVLEIKNQSRKSGSLYDAGNEIHNHNHRFGFHNFHRPNDPRYLARYASGSNYDNRFRPKKIPFSGDPTGSSHQLDPSCSHCFPPKEWSRSAQLLPPCRIHPGHAYCTCYAAAPPSPHWSLVDSEYRPWAREPNPDPPRRSQDLLRERHRGVGGAAAKRHLRPAARGAPFIACYDCRSLLQLPADFLLFEKKRHQLRCGACSRVLEFSLEKGSHIVRYNGEEKKKKKINVPVPVPVVAVVEPPLPPPPSVAEAVSSSSSRTPRRKSFSTEEANAAPTVVPTPLGRAFDRIIFGSAYTVEDMSSSELGPEPPSRGRYKDRPPRQPSNVIKSEAAEEDSQRSTSPLHRLMGYSSPSQVIRGLGTYGSYSSHKEKY